MFVDQFLCLTGRTGINTQICTRIQWFSWTYSVYHEHVICLMKSHFLHGTDGLTWLRRTKFTYIQTYLYTVIYVRVIMGSHCVWGFAILHTYFHPNTNITLLLFLSFVRSYNKVLNALAKLRLFLYSVMSLILCVKILLL